MQFFHYSIFFNPLFFILKVLTYHGFYDENSEWVAIEGIQIVGSVNSALLSGHHTLCSRFTSIMHICVIE